MASAPVGGVLTVIVTASLIPFEIYELAQGVTVARATTLVVNVAVVVYLIVRLWQRRKGSKQAERPVAAHFTPLHDSARG